MKTLNKDLLQTGATEELPEKVLQFGTGVLLRGLPDYFIEKANRQRIFNGRIVVVKSTGQGGTDEFARQDGLYTLHTNGLQNGKEVRETLLVSAISRVLHAATQWETIAQIAEHPDISIVISNTTEVGIVLDDQDDPRAAPPSSFPGRLTALLYRRFVHFNGDPDKGWVILPTELISDNGATLKSIVLELARRHGLGDEFARWIVEANDFCNTLVDRIVPGKLPENEAEEAEKQLGYRDALAIMAEPFRLWAIESNNDRVHDRLAFAQGDEGMIITPDISKFKELKLRLLNGSHTFSCGLAVLCGFSTVKVAMQHDGFARYVRRLMFREIADTIIGNGISEAEALDFAANVMDRFANPFLDHAWQSISLNYTSKMQMRNVASLERFIRKNRAVPRCMALGFAAYLYFMQGTHQVADEHAGWLAGLWSTVDGEELVVEVLRNEDRWGMDLNGLPGLADEIRYFLVQLQQKNALDVIQELNEEMELKLQNK
ncbi:tagaturonate reductase [Parapedobacter luteus]|uniref:Tagaturonate reductase n=1 Tax=Parapedobacter luteus TaxID=623280 RepID=A0A1T5CFQ1_9SPHI|nr:tagaturonate reductase [Parapedobacter luteus]SKB58318.1 tagaturonate reductase [Parapedobacter luteus]